MDKLVTVTYLVNEAHLEEYGGEQEWTVNAKEELKAVQDDSEVGLRFNSVVVE